MHGGIVMDFLSEPADTYPGLVGKNLLSFLTLNEKIIRSSFLLICTHF